uniref:Putative secreted peptide n=1 Tax=Anopheles braziliensis TaxID=58242 RepID=A0A2M3ZMJ1_9DIPT
MLFLSIAFFLVVSFSHEQPSLSPTSRVFSSVHTHIHTQAHTRTKEEEKKNSGQKGRIVGTKTKPAKGGNLRQN